MPERAAILRGGGAEARADVTAGWTAARVAGLVLLVVLAFAVRYTVFLAEPMVPKDGISYTESGINLVAGRGYVNATGEFRGKLQPLYPLLIGLTDLVLRDPTRSGALVSMVFGALLIVPVFTFTRAAYGLRPAWIAAALVVGYPYLANFGSTALTESTYTFFLFVAAAAGWRAWHGGRVASYAWCGVLTALAYLTRFEIAGYLVVFVAFVLVASRARLWRQALALVAVFVALVLPYHVYNWLQTGSALVVGRMDNAVRYAVRVRELGDRESPWTSFFGSPVGFARRYLKGVGITYTEYLPTLFPPVLIALTGAGLLERLRRRQLGFTEGYLVVIFAITFFGYPILRPSGRNLMVALPFLVVLLAKAVHDVAEMVAGLWRERAPSSTAIATAVTLILAVSMLPQTYRPLLFGADPVSPVELMEVGRWAKANVPNLGPIVTPDRRVTFYAGVEAVNAGRDVRGDYDGLVAMARTNGARHIALAAHVVSETDWKRLHEAIAQADELRLLHARGRNAKMTVELYELKDK